MEFEYYYQCAPAEGYVYSNEDDLVNITEEADKIMEEDERANPSIKWMRAVKRANSPRPTLAHEAKRLLQGLAVRLFA